MDKFAIIGISCLFPGADSPEAFWRILSEGRKTTSDATERQIGVDPAIFYDPRRGAPDTSYFLHGGYIQDFQFDPHGFALPAEVLAQLDPVFQWSLHVARDALSDSGYRTRPDVLARTGVVMGNLSFPTRLSSRLFPQIYDAVFDKAINDVLGVEGITLPRLPNNGVGTQRAVSLPNGESVILPYNGLESGYPAVVIAAGLGLGSVRFTLDAACASSLYAVALACHYLAAGKADLMLAGAVSAADPLFVNMGFAHLGGYPEPGKDSLPLDAASDGLIAGEGAGMFVLKRYTDAVRDGDSIYALVSGIGLSNDGRGKHVLTPNSKGQVLALERAYASAGLPPNAVDYIECHASGTALGDKTELNSMEMFFQPLSVGTRRAVSVPFIGSVKSNVGHLLTAAGMASMTKVILSLAHRQIPATIHVQHPLTSQNQTFAAAQIVTHPLNWQPQADSTRRAGVNAFGFGGVSAHLIIEANENQTMTNLSEMNQSPDRTPQPSRHYMERGSHAQRGGGTVRLAIVGMDAHFGIFDGLDMFARALFDGSTAFIDLPEHRWKGLQHHPEILEQLGLPDGKAPKGAYIGAFDIDFMKYRIPPNPADEPIPQHLILLKVADNAVRDANLPEGANVAVLVALGTELALHRYRGRIDLNWQIQQALQNAGMQLPPEQAAELERITKDSLLSPAQVNHYTSYIGNIAASRVSALWDFSGPTFTISSEENSVFRALEVAQMLLADGEVEAVVIGAVDLAGSMESVLLRNGLAPLHQGDPAAGIDARSSGWMIGEGAGAIVLQRADDAVQDRVYAVIDSLAVSVGTQHAASLPGAPTAQIITQAAQDALAAAHLTPDAIEYVELHASGIPHEDAAEIEAITSIYRGESPETAIGTVKANIGHTYAASGIASLIKTALCVYQRFIPAVPNWDTPEQPESWQGTPFWVATKSRTWFSDTRRAAVSSLGLDGSAAHVILSNANLTPATRRVTPPLHAMERGLGGAVNYLHSGSPVLLPITAPDAGAVLRKLADLRHALDEKDAPTLANAVYTDYITAQRSGPNLAYTLCLVGRDSDELRKQIDAAEAGVRQALANGGNWSTPTGSYFTANPVGRKGGVSFVYPGVFNSYPKMGYELFHLFPAILDQLQAVKSNLGEAVAERYLYPRTLEKPGPKVTKAMKTALIEDAIALIESGLSFALLYTTVMRAYFDVQPASAFGYSLGETGMMWGMGVWTDGDMGSANLRSSDVFTHRLYGPLNAIRDVWGIPADVHPDNVWADYFIAAPADEVQAAVNREHKVYLTHINTPNEVMIAGDPAACQRVLDAIGKESIRAPFNAVMHNETILGEYGELHRLHNLPVNRTDGVKFYSAADYLPLKLDRAVIANSIARMICKPVNFPRLVERAYADGARVFIELGPRSTCARWISESLGEREHVSVSIDALGVDSRTSVIRMLAQLVSHHVPLNLAPLYTELKPVDISKSLIRTVRLGGQDIYKAILAHQPEFEGAARAIERESVGTPYRASEAGTRRAGSLPTHTAMPADIHRVHADFLRARRDALRQMGEVIQMQMEQGIVGTPYRASEAAPSCPPIPAPKPAPAPSAVQGIKPLYDFEAVKTFAVGRVADCFGERYAIYDRVRAPRIPNGDLLLVSRAVDIEGERYQTRPGTAIHAEYDVPVDEWFYRDNPYPVMPYSVYMEIALQPSGFLSAYHGPTLDYPDIDFYFRNLDGYGILHRDVDMRGRTITNHTTLLRNTVLQGTIIQSFSFKLYDGDMLFYEGEATFGYFTKEALNSQAGLDAGKITPRWIDTAKPAQVITVNPHSEVGSGYLKLAHGMLEFTDEIQIVPNGGVYGQGYAYAHTIINPEAWFFKAHFYQDPVMPGSIGVETIMQALQAFAIETGLGDDFPHPRFAQVDGGHKIVWKYRGQILSDSEKSHIEAHVKRIERTPQRVIIYADASLWRDKLRIYEVKDIALAIVEA